MPWILGGAAVLGGLLDSGSQHKANRINIKLAREQRAWEENMANTAVRRRADDIERAGGNRALAFTNGQSASSPSISAPTVEPIFKGAGRDAASTAAQAMMMKAQLANLNADTAAKAADAKTKGVDAKIKEELYPLEKENKANRYVEENEWNDLKTKILRSQDVSSAAEARRLRDTVDSMIQTAKNQAKAGTLDVEALQNIAEVGGIEAGKMQSVIKMIIDLIKD